MQTKGQKSQRRLDLIPVKIQAKNSRQREVLKSTKHLLLSGYAGTGKTFLACSIGFDALTRGEVEKVVIIRSAVATRDMGFLPGNAAEKMEPYETPYQEIATELYSRGDAYEILKKNNKLEFMSTAYIRGISLHNALVIVDEFQNMNYHELDSIITRSGNNCRFIFSGDINQTDLKGSGFRKFFDVLTKIDAFDFVDFKKEDIVRSTLVKDYIIAKTEYEESSIK